MYTAAAGTEQMVMVTQRTVEVVAAVGNPDFSDGAALCQTAKIAVYRTQADIGAFLPHRLINGIGRRVLTAFKYRPINQLALAGILAGKRRFTGA